mmetsp:Transcript_43870/g.102589  ORF Transcript_43870/g.102589 Transcript_43870/m.102589 type:complete len:367 (-) Transcript_43870:476-1576(-)
MDADAGAGAVLIGAVVLIEAAQITHAAMQKSELLEVVATLDTGVQQWGGGSVCISGSLAYITGGWGLAIVDISDPAAPKRIQKVDTGVLCGSFFSSASGVALAGDFAIVVGGLGLAVVDVSVPAEAKAVAKLDTGVMTYDAGGNVVVSGKRAFVTGCRGVAIIDISDPRKPMVVAKGNPGVLSQWTAWEEGSGRSAIVDSTYIIGSMPYVGSHLLVAGRGLAVVDCTDPAAPLVVRPGIKTGVLTDKGGSVAVSDDGKTAYVVGGHGVRVVDVSNPWRPVMGPAFQTGVLTKAGGGHACLVGDAKLLVVGGLGMVLVDVTDPFKPTVLGRSSSTVATKEGGAFAAVKGKHAYVVGGRGLAVVELSF